MRATRGAPPAPAQQGLKNTLRLQGYFLACLCKPEADLTIERPGSGAVQKTTARVVEHTLLNREIVRIRLQTEADFAYRSGQFLHLHHPGGTIRSYSLASVPAQEDFLELHIRRLPEGMLSRWAHDELAAGDSVTISGPSGNCFYTPGNPEESLLLIGTGSGLAPLWGIVRDALYSGHTGPIHLYHGSWEPAGLYLCEELQSLAEQFPNFVYRPCVDSGPLPGMAEGRADLVAFAEIPDLKACRLFLCGHPGMVKTAKRTAYLAGVSLSAIYADPFVLSEPLPVPAVPGRAEVIAPGASPTGSALHVQSPAA
jgi:NAD(P)H-flavin reductase